MTEQPDAPHDTTAASVVVLMVDDDEEDVYLTRRAFRNRPRLKTFHTVSGADGLFRYLALAVEGDPDAPTPDLVLLDINLPGRNGFDILIELRASERWRALPVLVLSTSSSVGDVSRAHACGANAFLVKPVAAADMKEIADQVDAFWFTTARLPACGRFGEGDRITDVPGRTTG